MSEKIHPALLRKCPRLARMCKWVAILSDGEADACIRDYKAGIQYSSEAVNHFGGTRAVVERAIAVRFVVRKIEEQDRIELLAEMLRRMKTDTTVEIMVWINRMPAGPNRTAMKNLLFSRLYGRRFPETLDAPESVER